MWWKIPACAPGQFYTQECHKYPGDAERDLETVRHWEGFIIILTSHYEQKKACAESASHQEPHFSLLPSPRGLWRKSHSDEPCSLAWTDCCESCSKEQGKETSLKTKSGTFDTPFTPMSQENSGQVHFFLYPKDTTHKCTWLEPAGWAAREETGQCRGFCRWALRLGCSPPQSPQLWPPLGLQANVPVSPRPTWRISRNSTRRRGTKQFGGFFQQSLQSSKIIYHLSVIEIHSLITKLQSLELIH